MPARAKNALFGLLLIVLSSAAAALLLEAGLHLATGRKYLDVDLRLNTGPLTWEPNQRQRWKRIEWDVDYAINGKGFRDYETPRYPPTAVALGDSFTEGYGVELEESWPKRVEDALKTGVYNAGLQGRSPSDYIRVYETVFQDDPKLKLVLMGLDVSSDLEEPGGPSAFTPPPPVKGFSYKAKRFLCEHSVLYNFVRRPVRLSRRVAPLFAKLGLTPPFIYDPWATSEAYRPRWEYTAKKLADFGDALEKRGIRFVVLLIPMKLQVEDDTNEDLLRAAGRDPKTVQRTGFNDYFLSYAKERGLEVADALPPLRAANAKAPHSVYFRTDNHVNAAGQAVLADAVLAALRKKP